MERVRDMKEIWKCARVRIWSVVSLILVVLFAVITILSSTVFYEIIVAAIGGKRAVYADGIDPIYVSDYGSKAETLEAANALNERVCEEGFVLLKNEEQALPIKTPVSDKNISEKPRVSIFGKNSVNLAYGGTGSGGSTSNDVKTIYESLELAGYETNPVLKAFYEDVKRSGPVRTTNSNMDSGDTVVYSTAETPQSSYTQEVKDSYSAYHDAALVVFTRQGGEGADFPRSMKGAEGAREETDHFLQLDKNETELLQAVCAAGFDKVVVIINSGTPMELTFLEDPDYYAYQSEIDAAIWIGYPGNSGIMALGRILNGEVNPSGRLVDTYAADFKQDPTWYNFGDNRITGDMNATPKIPGGDLNLATFPESWADESDTGDMIVLRRCAKNVLYTVVNSNAMNGEIVGYKLPMWQILLIVVDCAVVIGIGVWGYFAIRFACKGGGRKGETG